MKLASYNIQFGVGLDGRYDPARIAQSLDGADIVCLQEVTRGFHANGYADLAATMADLFAGYHSVFSAPADVYLGMIETEDGKRVARRLQFGNMVLSRWPILSVRTLLLPRARTFDKLNVQRCATEALIDAPGGALRVYSVHLDHVSPEERIAQIGELKARANLYVEEGGGLTGGADFDLPALPMPEDYVLMGDFNMQPESPEYVAMTGPVDAYYGRVARHPHPVDALDRMGRLTPGCYSWMDPRETSSRLHLDYAFISCGLLPRLKDAHVDLEPQGSDHFPVWLELAD